MIEVSKSLALANNLHVYDHDRITSLRRSTAQKNKQDCKWLLLPDQKNTIIDTTMLTTLGFKLASFPRVLVHIPFRHRHRPPRLVR